MTMQEVKRKLVAILSADVKGYSRLMGEDEKGTIRTLNAYKGLMANLIQEHHGRVVDAPGDNLLAEFGSVVDAVECAVEIQKELKNRNGELPENRRMEFRIGVNLGDVIEEEARIYGDGVNIAARLESLSEAGGICISGTGFDQVKNKLSVGYQYLGKQTVKNIPDPVRAYKVLMQPEAAGKVIGEKELKETRWGWKAAVAVVVLALVAGGLVWNFYLRTPRIERASKAKMALPLPDKPSIAVLPFVNLSGDPKKDYLSDGITEEIINGLSKMPTLFVIARNSTFTYKGKSVRVQQVSEEMGVQYVMEGSVQWSGDRVRISVQLIDALKGHHLFSDRYDRELKDIFAIQDEITIKALTAMRAGLSVGEGDAIAVEKGTKNIDAYLKLMQSLELVQNVNKDNIILARRLAEEALALDPKFVNAYANLAMIMVIEAALGVSKSPKDSLDRAEKLAKKGIVLNNSNWYAHGALSLTCLFKKQYDKALSSGERAVSLNPNSQFSWYVLGVALLNLERYEEAIPHLKKSLRLSPVPLSQTLFALANSYRFLGRYDEAIATYKKLIQIDPAHSSGHAHLAVTYVLAGRQEEARAEAAEVMRIDPQFSVERYAQMVPYNQAVLDQQIEALRKAGLK
jgi:adenylate cyclase